MGRIALRTQIPHLSALGIAWTSSWKSWRVWICLPTAMQDHVGPLRIRPELFGDELAEPLVCRIAVIAIVPVQGDLEAGEGKRVRLDYQWEVLGQHLSQNGWHRPQQIGADYKVRGRQVLRQADLDAVTRARFVQGLLQKSVPVDRVFHQQMVMFSHHSGGQFKLPTTVITTSAADGPNGPVMPQVAQLLPDAPVVHRPGEINAWDNENFVVTVAKTGRKKLIVAGI